MKKKKKENSNRNICENRYQLPKNVREIQKLTKLSIKDIHILQFRFYKMKGIIFMKKIAISRGENQRAQYEIFSESCQNSFLSYKACRLRLWLLYKARIVTFDFLLKHLEAICLFLNDSQ